MKPTFLIAALLAFAPAVGAHAQPPPAPMERQESLDADRRSILVMADNYRAYDAVFRME